MADDAAVAAEFLREDERTKDWSSVLPWFKKGVILARAVQRQGAEIKRLRTALEEIRKGEGAYSRDKLDHAHNCIISMQDIATTALAAKPETEKADA